MPVPAPIPVLNASGLSVNVNAPLDPGRAVAADSRPVALSIEDLAAINALGTLLTTISGNVDGLEGFTDGIEALLGTTNTNLTTIAGYVDGLEGFVDGLEALTGGVTETAPASDTASSGLNGRLQRVAQRLSTLITATGTIGDATLTAGNSGSLLAMIRTMMEQTLSTAAAAVKIDQTTDGTTNLVRNKPDTTAHALIPAPSTYRLLSAAASTNGANIKASAGTVKGIQGYNAKASAVYLKLYNKASSPTVGTDTPVKTIYLPASAAFAFDFGTGVAFATGISIALTGAGADADTTALVSGDVLALNVDYH